jgi:hypothetical protein
MMEPCGAPRVNAYLFIWSFLCPVQPSTLLGPDQVNVLLFRVTPDFFSSSGRPVPFSIFLGLISELGIFIDLPGDSLLLSAKARIGRNYWVVIPVEGDVVIIMMMEGERPMQPFRADMRKRYLSIHLLAPRPFHFKVSCRNLILSSLISPRSVSIHLQSTFHTRKAFINPRG